MKYIFLSLMISLSAHAMIAKVPSAWLTSEDIDQKSFATGPEEEKLKASFQNILEAKQTLFNSMKDSGSRWYLQSFLTELAIEAEGEIGVLGTGGEAAVELVWIKKNQEKVLKTEEEVSTEPDLQIGTSMTEEALKKEIAPIVDLAMSTGHIRKRAKFFKNLMNEALKFQDTARELENSPVLGPWYVYKYQLELFVSVEGKIAFIDGGNSLRLRMEWWRLQKNDSEKSIVPYLPVELSSNAKLVAAMANDIQAADRTVFDNGFVFNCLKMGVGTTIEGDLFLAKGKAKAVGSLFFKRDEQVQPKLTIASVLPEVSEYALQAKASVNQVPRFSFRRGIQKAMSITHFFAKNAKTKNPGQFELNVIEVEFEIFANGGVGVVTLEGATVLTLFVTRNVTI